MTDLVAFVLKIKPAAPIPERPLPNWWGRAVQAWLLQLISTRDPVLANTLHDDQTPPPYTVSTLLGYSQHRGLSPETEYALRITIVEKKLAHLLLAELEPGKSLAEGAGIELDHLPFCIHSVYTQPEQHNWAAATDYNSLASAYLLSGSESARRFTMRIFSPCFFKSHNVQMPLPLPGLLFGGLLERWNTYSPLTFPAELRRYAEECLVISRVRLSSRNVEIKENVRRTGGLGEVTYTATNPDRYWLGMIDTLAHFAFYAGVGASSAMGLGQCWLQPQEKPIPKTKEE